MNISIVYGGTSEERYASSQNAHDIADALNSKGYKTKLIEFGMDIMATIKAAGTDVVFVCTQGKGYGDGTLQGMLEHEKIPYTGSGMRAASLINDKILCKSLFDKYNIRTPKWEILYKSRFMQGDFDFDALGYPFVAKAPTQGGSYGITLIQGPDDLPKIEDIFKYDDPILLERYINGKFYTAGIYERKGDIVSLPVVEGRDLDLFSSNRPDDPQLIVFTGNYDIAKSSLEKELEDEILKTARKVWNITYARGLARVDFMVSDTDNEPYVLEINAVPGLKRNSLMPREAQLMGIAYEDFIEDILLTALNQYTI